MDARAEKQKQNKTPHDFVFLSQPVFRAIWGDGTERMGHQTLQVAPGMEVCYVVIFEPQEVRAYSAELMVVTEREKFVVPIGAIGHRAVLDFPDQVRGSFCPNQKKNGLHRAVVYDGL